MIQSTMDAQSKAACQQTDGPTTLQQSEAACHQTNGPTSMQQSEAACQQTDGPTTMQQSEAACQQTDGPTTMQQEAPVPAPSAVTDSPQRTENIGNTGTVSGSNNPIFVGASGVNVTYNFPLEGPGVPAPRLHHEQRPDQQPRLMDAIQAAGNKTRDILMRVYKTTGKYVQLSPGIHDDQRPISKIYTRLQIRTKGGTVEEKYTESIVYSTDYETIFKNRHDCNRFILFGTGGVGKSTIFNMITLDWAVETNDFLNTFNLVFLLKMCALSQNYHLVDSIFDQLLGEDSEIEKDELDKFIQANSNKVLILLDGFDEMMTKTLNADSFGSILKALNRKRYRECYICVSTRPSHLETLISESLVQNPCTHVEVLGFTDEDVSEYIRKFCDKDPDSGNELIQTIAKSNTLRELSTNPMLLLLMCLLWKESKQLPETTSRLFNEAVGHMFTRKQISKENGSNTVISIGQTALRGLMSANQKFSFQEQEFQPTTLNLALKAGILTKQRVITNRKSHNDIQFMHKTVQEYCAAKYLQNVRIMSNRGLIKRTVHKVLQLGDFHNSLRQLCQTIEGVVSNEFLFRFCCGENEKCMTDIVKLLDRKFNKDQHGAKYQSHVIQAISRNCFFESQSIQAPRCLTSDSHIPSTIEVRSNNDFHSLVYLLKITCRSESRTAQLARVRSINVSSVSSVGDLAFALGYMGNLRALRLSGCPLVKGDLEKTMSSLKCNILLTELCIKGDSTLGGRAVEWAPHIKHLTSLNRLEISDCKLQITDTKHIASCVSDYMPNLTDLILAGNTALGGSAHSWAKNLPRFTTVQTLNLRSCALQWTDIKHIVSAVGDMPNLTDLILSDNQALGVSTEKWSRYLLRVKQKHTLDLSNFSLPWEDADTISFVLNHIPTLTSLNLAGNTEMWGKDNWFRTEKLFRYTNIQTLNLRNCALHWPDIEHIALAVGDMPRLTDLILTDNPALGVSTEKLSRYLVRVKRKHTLDLSSFSLTLEDFGTISIVLDHLPNLTNLILAGNTSLGESADLWAKNLSRFTNIQTLDLSNCTLQWTDIEHIASAVSDVPSLIDLILSGNTSLGRSAELWVKNLSRFTNIQTLDLSNCTLQWTDIEHIASAVSDVPSLIDLSLSGNTSLGRSAELWVKNLSRITSIQTLNLSNCTLQWTDIEQVIASAVSDMPKLTDLILTDNPALGESTEIEKWSRYLLRVKQNHTLDLSNFSLTGKDIGWISVVLDHFPKLINLILAGNAELGGWAKMWAKNLSQFTNMQTLNLRNCALQWTDIEHIASAVCVLPRLTELILADNPALGVSIEKWSRYLLRVKQNHTLDLSNFSLTGNDIGWISVVLDHCPKLINLILADNTALGGSAAKLWAKNLSRFTQIQTLDLSNCKLQWTDIKHIASAVSDVPSLIDLILSGNTSLGRSAELWVKNLSRITSIQTLNLSNCTLQWTDIEQVIALAVSDMPKLTDLILTDNPALGESTEIEKWSRYLLRVKQNHTLDLSNFSLTGKDIGWISVVLDHFPKLINLILAGNAELGGWAKLWAKNLSQFTNMQTLNLRNCALQWTDIEHIASAVCVLPRLTELILADNPALGVSIKKWSRYLLRVKQNHTLDLSNFSLTGNDIGWISVVLDHCPKLINLILAGNTALGGSAAKLWAKNLSRFTKIQTLDLSNCKLQWTDIKHIASAVSDVPSLIDLILSGNTSLGRSAELWVKNLSRITSIQTLNLSNCTLQWTDIEHIVLAVGDMPRLTKLILADNPALGVSIEKWSRYLLRVKQHTLDLSNFSLTGKDIGWISVVLDHFPKLINLILAGNTALGGSAYMWAQHLLGFTNIQTLNLTNCTLQWTDIRHIASAVSEMPRLTDLSLNGNRTLGESAEVWVKELPKMTHLNRLNLSNCNLTPEDIEHIAYAADYIIGVTDLYLGGNPGSLGGLDELQSLFAFIRVHIEPLFPKS